MIRIVALGDSTTAGTPGFRSPLEAPPSGAGDLTSQYAWWLMQAHPGWEVLNRGVNGERTDQIRARFDRDVLDAAPSVVIIIAGVNDVYQGRAAAEVIEQLRGMYDTATAAGRRGSAYRLRRHPRGGRGGGRWRSARQFARRVASHRRGVSAYG